MSHRLQSVNEPADPLQHTPAERWKPAAIHKTQQNKSKKKKKKEKRKKKGGRGQEEGQKVATEIKNETQWERSWRLWHLQASAEAASSVQVPWVFFDFFCLFWNLDIRCSLKKKNKTNNKQQTHSQPNSGGEVERRNSKSQKSLEIEFKINKCRWCGGDGWRRGRRTPVGNSLCPR